jgi:pantoate--beta-alanine ligase
MVLSRMVRDLFLDIDLVFVETVRESDGLALSSRNQYLNAEERSQAPVLYRALLEAQAAVRNGESDSTRIRALAGNLIQTAPSAVIDYIEIVDAESLRPLASIDRPAVLALAVRFGQTRLIDNISLS